MTSTLYILNGVSEIINHDMHRVIVLLDNDYPVSNKRILATAHLC